MARLAGGLVLAAVLGIAVLGLRRTEVTRRRPFWIVQHAGNLRMFLAAGGRLTSTVLSARRFRSEAMAEAAIAKQLCGAGLTMPCIATSTRSATPKRCASAKRA